MVLRIKCLFFFISPQPDVTPQEGDFTNQHIVTCSVGDAGFFVFQTFWCCWCDWKQHHANENTSVILHGHSLVTVNYTQCI